MECAKSEEEETSANCAEFQNMCATNGIRQQHGKPPTNEPPIVENLAADSGTQFGTRDTPTVEQQPKEFNTCT